VNEQDGRALWMLRSKWLGLYQVSLVGGEWRARRYRGDPVLLTANTADQLGQKVQADHDVLPPAIST